MNRVYFVLLLAILLLVLAFGMHSCKSGQKQEKGKVVSVSILPLQYFADRLTGNALDVNVMVPPGASHGSYSPTPQQFRKLSDSRLYIRIGHLGYEQAWIGRLRELNPYMAVINLSDHVELIRGEAVDHGDHSHESGVDPHIWMSPVEVLQLLPLIRDAIMEAFPELKEVVEQNYPLVAEEVEEVHQLFAGLSGSLSNKSFMIYHPALTYLARDYGFRQVSVEHEGKEPSPAMLGRIIRDAREFAIPVVFIQEEYDMRSAGLISQETGASLVQINPLAYNWIESMHKLGQSFTEHLQ